MMQSENRELKRIIKDSFIDSSQTIQINFRKALSFISENKKSKLILLNYLTKESLSLPRRGIEGEVNSAALFLEKSAKKFRL